MGIEEVPTPEHWNYFLALEDDVDRLSRYLEPTQANFSAYSLELARILFGAASEIDVVAKRLCEQINADSNADNIVKYREEIVLRYPEIKDVRVLLPKFGLTLNPWEQWGDGKSPFWWKAYNNVKHHRHTSFADANLKNSLNATAALFVLLLFFYKKEAEHGRLNPDPRLFRAGAPFQVDKLFYAPHTFTYQLLSAD